jgi:hypothetical protein
VKNLKCRAWNAGRLFVCSVLFGVVGCEYRQYPEWRTVKVAAQSGYTAAKLGIPWETYSNSLYSVWITNR